MSNHAELPKAMLSSPYTADDEIDLLELFKNLWLGKWWIISFTAVAAALGRKRGISWHRALGRAGNGDGGG